jgi:hypothetical protein
MFKAFSPYGYYTCTILIYVVKGKILRLEKFANMINLATT